MKKAILILTILCLCLSDIHSQILSKMIVNSYNQDNIAVNICNDGNLGIIVFYSAIQTLKFEAIYPRNAIVNTMYKSSDNCYILCVQPQESANFSVKISADGFYPETYVVGSFTAKEKKIFMINPENNTAEIKVYDKKYRPIDGARIQVKGKEDSKRTDSKGVCEMPLPSSKETTLVISFRNYDEKKEITVKPGDKKSVYFNTIDVNNLPKTTGYNEDDKKFRFGLFGGMSVATQTTDSWLYESKNSASVGYYAGMQFEFKFGRYVSFQPELLFVQKGSKGQTYTSDYYIYTETGNFIPDVLINSKVQIHYLEFPLNCVFNIPIGRNSAIFLGTGLYLSCGLSGKMTLDPSKEGITFYLSKEEKEADVFGGEEPLFSRFDYGLDFLAGYRYKRFFARAGYSLGLFNIATGNPSDGWAKFKNSYFNLSVGVKF